MLLQLTRKSDDLMEKLAQDEWTMTEVECLEKIQHGNIVKLYEYDLNCVFEGTQHCLVALELLPHGELFEHIYHNGPMSVKLAKVYFVEALSALAACHEMGVVHRDVKLQNLILDKHWNVKLIDFGFAHFEKNGPMQGCVGTSGYQRMFVLRKEGRFLTRPHNSTRDVGRPQI